MADTKLSALGAATITDADELYFNDGGTSAKGTVAALRTALGGVGYLPMDITSMREIASNDIQNLAAVGGILASDSAPALLRLNGATDKALAVTWATGNLDEAQFPPIPMPADLDETSDITIHLLVKMSGGADTSTNFDVQVFDGIGDTEMGGSAGNFTSSLVEYVVTILAANISGNPTGFLNISLVPSGAHGTDTIQLVGAWGEYTKKLPV